MSPRAARLPPVAAVAAFVLALASLAILREASKPDYRLSEAQAIRAAEG